MRHAIENAGDGPDNGRLFDCVNGIVHAGFLTDRSALTGVTIPATRMSAVHRVHRDMHIRVWKSEHGLDSNG